VDLSFAYNLVEIGGRRGRSKYRTFGKDVEKGGKVRSMVESWEKRERR